MHLAAVLFRPRFPLVIRRFCRPLGGLFAGVLMAYIGNFSGQAQELPKPEAAGETIVRLGKELEKVLPSIQGSWTAKWASTVVELPQVEPKVVRSGNKDLQVDEKLFYTGRYGSPLAYIRCLDLAEQFHFAPRAGTKVFDFGYGSIGHLRMFALSHLHAVGVDVDPLLPLLYEKRFEELGKGSVKLFHGKYPSENDLAAQIGNGYDLVISKNTLKRGYIHPTREPTNPRHVIDLGVKDEVFLAALANMLNPKGLLVIYNFCPAKAPLDKPYIPWAEGECPFTKEQLEAAGLEVVAFDVDDNKVARKLASDLGWDANGAMNVETDLFAWYTVARKR